MPQSAPQQMISLISFGNGSNNVEPASVVSPVQAVRPSQLFNFSTSEFTSNLVSEVASTANMNVGPSRLFNFEPEESKEIPKTLYNFGTSEVTSTTNMNV